MKRFTARTTDDHFTEPNGATLGRALDNQSTNSEVLGKVPTVLIVESDPIARNILRGILFRRGFMVLDAVNHAEALQLLRAMAYEEIDLLIAGHPAADDGLRSLSREACILRPGVKTLFIFGGDGLPEDAVQPGCAVLQKPITESRLLEAVSELLEPRTQ